MANVKYRTIVAEMKATIETMRSQYTDLLYRLEQTQVDLVAERNNRAKLFAGLEHAEAELAALRDA